MKNVLLYSVLTIQVLAITALSGCEKDDISNEADKNALLTANIWYFDKLSTTSKNSEIQLACDLMATIFTDATIKFDINGGYTMTIMDMPDSGTWELNEDGTKLILDKGTAAEVVHGLTTLTSDVLEYTESLEEDGTGNFELTYRWVK